MAANFEFLFVSSIANLTEGHLPTGNRVANAHLLIRGSLIIPLLLKIPRLNVFSENCEEKWIFIEFERFVKKKSVAFRVGTLPDFLAHKPLGGCVNRREQIRDFRREKFS